MADITSVLTKRGNLSKPYYIKADMMQEQRRLEIILMRERWKLIQSGVSRTHIKIRNSNIYVKNKLHGLVMGSEFKPATTMDSLLGDCEQSPYSAAKSNPIVSLNDSKSPPVGQQPLLLWGKKKQTLLHIPLHCVLLLRQVAPIHWLSPVLPQENIRPPQWAPLLTLQVPPQFSTLLIMHQLSNILQIDYTAQC